MSVEIQMESHRSTGDRRPRSSKLIPGYGDDAVEGLQFRRGSRKFSLPLDQEIKPSKLEESDDSIEEELVPYAPVSNQFKLMTSDL
jgi:hypothetical protein